MISNELNKKETLLRQILCEYGSAAVAFSGGVDSTLLLAAAQKTLGGNVVALTAVSPLQSQSEREDAVRFAEMMGVRHELVDVPVMQSEDFIKNTRERCYICKKIIFGVLSGYGKNLGLRTLVHGANVDDLNDYRPGFKAAEELNVKAPLLEAGFTKKDVRELSKKWGLPAWNKPAMACLATRIPYHTPICEKTLIIIEKAEKVLSDLDFSGTRVRRHGNMARIEINPKDFDRLVKAEVRKHISEAFTDIGFEYTTIDIIGYVSGGMNK